MKRARPGNHLSLRMAAVRREERAAELVRTRGGDRTGMGSSVDLLVRLCAVLADGRSTFENYVHCQTATKGAVLGMSRCSVRGN